MRLYGALSELASLVIRLPSGKTVTISSAEQNVDKTISIPALPEAVNSDEIVLKEAEQTLRRKTLEGVVTSGVSSVKLQSADVTSTNALEVPNGNPSISTGLRRLSSTGNLLYLGTGTAFKEMVDKDSSQQLKNKTIVAGSGIDENAITNLNPASANVFATVGGHADKVVKYDNSGIPQVAKIVNANIDDAAGIVGSKLADNSVAVAKLASMSSADLAGKITDETGSGALVFANNPTIGTITAASGVLSLTGTGALKVPAGLQSERPGSPVEGMIRYNSETDSFEGYASNTWSGLGGGGTVDRVTQLGHGFVVGDVLWLNGLTYTKAKADATNTAEVVGMVSRFIDVDNFEMTLSGEVSGLSGLTPGEVYFLSASTAGALTVTEPSVVGQVSLPVGVASSATSLYVAPKRGVVIGGANLRTQLGLNGAALVSQTTNIQNVKDYDAGELSGWVYIDATTDRRFYIQVQFVKNAAGAWNCAYQTTGDTPPAGFNVDVIVSGSDAFVQIQMPAVAGWVSGSVNFALNAPAVGATLPLQVNSANVSFTDIKAASASGITFKEDGGTAVGSVSDAGAWVLGPSSSNVNHTANGSINFAATTTTGNAASVYQSGARLRLNGGTGGYAFQSSDGVTSLGLVESTGAWTLGPSNATATIAHTVSGALKAQCGFGNYHVLFRNSAGVIGAAALVLSRSDAETGGTVYVEFFESGTSASSGGGSAGGIRRNTGDTAYEFYSASDERLKDIHGTYNLGLQTVLAIPVKYYSWKGEKNSGSFGYIAQDVQQHLPSCVSTGNDGYLNLGTADMIPVMWNAIQEQQEQIEALKAEIQLLKNK